jgi:hypothetical protein
MSAVDEGFGQVQLSAIAQILGQPTQDALEHSVGHPLLVPAVAGLIRRKPPREISPGRAGAQDPKDPIEDGPCVLPRPTALRPGQRQLVCR